MRTAAALRVAGVVCLATCLAMLPLTRITADRTFLWQGAIVVVVLSHLSAALRLMRVPAALVHLGQVVALAAIMGVDSLLVRTPSGAHLGWHRLVNDGVTQITTQAAPIPANPASRWLIVGFIGLVLVVTDLLATTLAAPAWSMAPLATLYLVPALAAPGHVPWWMFALLALGYLALLAVDTVNASESWTRNISTDTARRPSAVGRAWPLAVLVGVPAVAAAVGVGLITPLFSNQTPFSQTRSASSVQMHDPTITLSHDLNQPRNGPVLTYTTSDGQGLYLRMAALTVVSPSGWNFPVSGVVLRAGRIAAAPGARNDQHAVTGTVHIGNLSSEYLPLPYAVTHVQAPGVWRWNAATMMVISTALDNRLTATRNLSYDFSASQVQPNPSTFSQARAGVPADDAATVTAVPKDVPPEIVELAKAWTRGARSDAEKAAMLQQHLTDPRVFTYDTSAPSGSGYGVLVDFLTRSHRGYCIHFASAMALMARIVGIPSRVASGFLPGHRVGDHWEVDSHDAHAWPELYFDGYGWVRFEPTASAGIVAPPWTHNGAQAPRPLPSASASSSRPSVAPTPAHATSLRPRPAPRPTTPSGSAGTAPQAPSAPLPWARILGVSGGALGVLAVVLGPWALRSGLRRRRLGPHSDPHEAIADAWRELQASRRDLGHPWPAGSPRAVVEQLSTSLDRDAAAALARTGILVERSRYAPDLGLDRPGEGTVAPGGEVASATPGEQDAVSLLPDDVARIRSAWQNAATPAQRLRARLAPRSLWLRSAS